MAKVNAKRLQKEPLKTAKERKKKKKEKRKMPKEINIQYQFTFSVCSSL
jgi:hypothetical protein